MANRISGHSQVVERQPLKGRARLFEADSIGPLRTSPNIKRGAKAIPSNGMEPLPSGGALLDEDKGRALSHSAFRNPDGEMVVVLANRGPQRQMQLVLDRKSLDLAVPADSLMTLR